MDKKELRKKKIGVLLGGTSSEREVSLKSGNAVCKALESRGYRIAPIDAAGDLCAALRKQKIDIAFIALHGGYGENGAVQGLLEVMGIPYTGSGVLASALAMDKEISKKMFVAEKIPVPPFRMLDQKEFARAKRLSDWTAGFPLPWVVKPAAEGSSVGVEIVRTKDAFERAAKNALAYGGRVLIEKYLKGREVQIAILNDKVLGGVEVKPSLEFYSYEAKYTAGLTEYIFPPRLAPAARAKADAAALGAHCALCCSGATRVDLIVDRLGRPYVLEVNTIPGMTETSLLPKIAQQAGFDFPALLEEILAGVAG